MHSNSAATGGVLGLYQRTPLYVRIAIALALGIVVGLLLGKRAGALKPIGEIVLKLLSALATPLIFCALTHALLSAQVSGRAFLKLLVLLLTNTLIAILIGLTVANLIQPGRWAPGEPSEAQAEMRKKVVAASEKVKGPIDLVVEKVPGSVLAPLAENDIIAVIAIAGAFGVALRMVRDQQAGQVEQPYRTVEQFLDTVFRCVLIVLHWVFHLVPLAVFAVVARLVGEQGFAPFLQLGGFVVAVLLALALQASYYLLRVRWQSWVRPRQFLKGGSDALVMAFSTASSTATLPVTFECMVKKIGVREENASLGVMVGGNLNNDGTALYEAMAALFIAQLLGISFGLGHQFLIVAMAVFASVGAAGIPEAGLVTMVAVFRAVDLPLDMIPFLLTIDWFLDRCRTAINVMGDMCVTCVLDGTTRHQRGDDVLISGTAGGASTDSITTSSPTGVTETR